MRLPFQSPSFFLHSMFNHNKAINKHHAFKREYAKKELEVSAKSSHDKFHHSRIFGGAHVEKSIIKRVFNTHKNVPLFGLLAAAAALHESPPFLTHVLFRSTHFIV